MGDNLNYRTHKSAPIVALYWLLNRLMTYWFMRDVLQTLQNEDEHARAATGKSLGQRTLSHRG